MKLLALSIMTLTLTTSCSSRKYQYIEVAKEQEILGDTNITEKDPELITAPNDSTAYIQAFRKFYVSIKVFKDMQETYGMSAYKPIDFKLINDKGIDISKTISFVNKELTEQEISNEILSKENGLEELQKKAEKDRLDKFKASATIDSAKIKELEKYFNQRKDEFDPSGRIWYEPKSAPQYVNRNGIYCYFQTINGVPSNLRFRIQYCANKWLFFNKVQFSIDGNAYEYIPNDTETDNGDGGMIWEWFDENLSVKDKNLIEAIANAKNAKMKFIGRQYYDIRTISQQQILDIKRTLDLYRAMGGKY